MFFPSHLQLSLLQDELSRAGASRGSGPGVGGTTPTARSALYEDAIAALSGNDGDRATYLSKVAKQLEADLEQVRVFMHVRVAVVAVC